MTNTTEQERTVWTVNDAPLRRGAMVETDDGGLGHYVGTTAAGEPIVCYRADRWTEACRRFDTIERKRRRTDR